MFVFNDILVYVYLIKSLLYLRKRMRTRRRRMKRRMKRRKACLSHLVLEKRVWPPGLACGSRQNRGINPPVTIRRGEGAQM